MTIYIVRGTSGEYSDRSEWIVRAVRNERGAKEAVKKLSELSRLQERERQDNFDNGDGNYCGFEPTFHAPALDKLRAADPGWDGYTPATYYFSPCELEDA